MSTATFPSVAEVLENNRAVVVDDAFLDWLGEHRPALAARLRTIPNPDRVGILDRWVAYTKGNCPVPYLEHERKAQERI